MQLVPNSAPQPGSDPLAVLLELARRAREARDAAELAFIVVNDTHALAPYRQAALWFAGRGVQALSGVVQIEANAPYAQWLDRVCRSLVSEARPRTLGPADLPERESAEWDEWLPTHALWLPLAPDAREGGQQAGGLLLARDEPWQKQEVALVSEWIDICRHAWHAQHAPAPWSPRRAYARLAAALRLREGRPWWKQRAAWCAAAAAAILLVPVRLTVLAPGELVPANPAAIRAPLDGVVASFAVRPNEEVKAGQPLFDFDDAPLAAKLAVASQELATSLAEYRQAAQLALSDAKWKAQLAALTGKIEERRAEAEFLQGQLARAHVLAPAAGVALFDDPVEWIGKPVVTGERIMRIAARGDIEIEAWLAVGDAIPLEPGAAVRLYLNASPFSSVSATLRYVAHDAVQRPDGSYAYRVRAALAEPTDHRVGLKGTAKLAGGWVPAVYWVLRRPIASVRQALGW
ncbi:MAG TPA: HlyD family efflux transporter periplasmic adaptor subunit [Burkholderiales bacterium]|nr:HlyD family efflux transporter periplasmic adaptor subunit [Burkholderiales bacterium]